MLQGTPPALIDRDFFKLVKRKKKTLASCYFTCSTRVFKKKQELANQTAIGKQPPAGKQQRKKRRRRTKLVARGEGRKKGERSRKSYIATKTTTTTTTPKKKTREEWSNGDVHEDEALEAQNQTEKRTKRWRERASDLLLVTSY